MICINCPLDGSYCKIDILNKTEKNALVKMRLAQRLFRKKLFLYDPKCKICGFTIAELLVGSHSKDWASSNNYEKTDFFNGFLLCPAHDSLFDKGFISFDDNKKYLKWHREHKFKN